MADVIATTKRYSTKIGVVQKTVPQYNRSVPVVK